MFLNLNYSPEVVVDTTTLTEKEWLESVLAAYREKIKQDGK